MNGSFTDKHRAARLAAEDVNAPHRFHPVERAFFHHAAPAALVLIVAPFFRGLKEQPDGPVQVFFGEQHRGAEQHRGVRVMAARMHYAGDARLVRNVVGFLDRQRIHIRAQCDGWPEPVAERRHNTGLGHPTLMLDAQRIQPVRHQLAGLDFLKAKLGVCMNLPANFYQVRLQRSRTI